jgi:hypothetical protein
LQQLASLAGSPANGPDIARSLEQAEALLGIVAKVWEVPASDVPPALVYSADWDQDGG